jgi:hypothetical protein
VSSISVSHGGYSGDILYSLALTKHLSSVRERAIDYYISRNRPANLLTGMSHPNGREFLMSDAAFRFLEPLLAVQPWINQVYFVTDEQIPADALRLDAFRYAAGINLAAGNIVDYPGKLHGFCIDSSAPWLVTRPVKDDPSALTLCLSKRYRNTSIDYSFVAQLPNVRFIGLNEEYEDFRARYHVPNVRYVACANALEFAEVIKSSRVFIGNQSMAFAVAEALKVRRALESCEICPNVVPTGAGAGSFIHQSALLYLLQHWGLPLRGATATPRAANYVLDLPALPETRSEQQRV